MRNLLIIAILLFAAFTAGWFTVNRDGDRTTIEINKSEIRQDTREVIDRGKEFLRQQELQNSAMNGPQGQGFPSWNQQQPEAAQAGYWNGDVGQNSYPSTGFPQGNGQAWPQAAPEANWQYPASATTNPYPQSYPR